MNCAQVQWKISQAENNREPWPPSIEAHLRTCTACRQFASAIRRLQPLPPVPPPVGLHVRIMAEVRSRAHISRRSECWRWAIAGAVIVLIAMLFAITHQTATNHAPVPQPIAAASKHMPELPTEVMTAVAKPYRAELERLQRDWENAAAFLRDRLTAWPVPVAEPAL